MSLISYIHVQDNYKREGKLRADLFFLNNTLFLCWCLSLILMREIKLEYCNYYSTLDGVKFYGLYEYVARYPDRARMLK